VTRENANATTAIAMNSKADGQYPPAKRLNASGPVETLIPGPKPSLKKQVQNPLIEKFSKEAPV
jgi:hypothetical protein